jgi:hypothetical protein
MILSLVLFLTKGEEKYARKRKPGLGVLSLELVELVRGDDVEGESGDVAKLELDLLHGILLKVCGVHYRRRKIRDL